MRKYFYFVISKEPYAAGQSQSKGRVGPGGRTMPRSAISPDHNFHFNFQLNVCMVVLQQQPRVEACAATIDVSVSI